MKQIAIKSNAYRAEGASRINNTIRVIRGGVCILKARVVHVSHSGDDTAKSFCWDLLWDFDGWIAEEDDGDDDSGGKVLRGSEGKAFAFVILYAVFWLIRKEGTDVTFQENTPLKFLTYQNDT